MKKIKTTKTNSKKDLENLPTISVVMPVYNEEAKIKIAVC